MKSYSRLPFRLNLLFAALFTLSRMVTLFRNFAKFPLNLKRIELFQPVGKVTHCLCRALMEIWSNNSRESSGFKIWCFTRFNALAALPSKAQNKLNFSLCRYVAVVIWICLLELIIEHYMESIMMLLVFLVSANFDLLSELEICAHMSRTSLCATWLAEKFFPKTRIKVRIRWFPVEPHTHETGAILAELQRSELKLSFIHQNSSDSSEVV